MEDAHLRLLHLEAKGPSWVPVPVPPTMLNMNYEWEYTLLLSHCSAFVSYCSKTQPIPNHSVHSDKCQINQIQTQSQQKGLTEGLLYLGPP